MSKKFKSQASSARAASGFGTTSFGFGAPSSNFRTNSSPLSYVTELPDLSGISEPNLVVAFKNLSKKDSVTKAKALEELQDYLSSVPVAEKVVESGVLEAWINIYPRTSIDNSRRVRQLAHTLQGLFTTLSGKRIARYLAKVIGPWLSGTFDNDKSVLRSAQDAFEKAFPSEEKRKAVWKLYQSDLIEFADDAILTQTPMTLSDGRTTSPDDAEAKHVRVVGTAMLMLTQMIQNLAVDHEREQPKSNLSATLSASKLWEYANHKDPYVRRAAFLLTVLCVDKFPSEMNWKTISACFIAKALHVSQLGSSLQFVEALLAITDVYPGVWTNEYPGKSSAKKRLLQFLRQGSQRGPEPFWTTLGRLIQKIPISVWSSSDDLNINLNDADTLLHALHEGVTNIEEPRPNASAAWIIYANTCYWVTSLSLFRDDKGVTVGLIEKHLIPAIDQFILPASDQFHWSIPAPAALRICSEFVLTPMTRFSSTSFESVWSRQIERLIEAMRLSLPVSSKDFISSQEAIIAAGNRIFALQTEITKRLDRDEGLASNVRAKDILRSSNKRIIEAALEMLITRNGKPYGAAGLLNAGFERLPGLAAQLRETTQHASSLEAFMEKDLPKFLDSPSSNRLVSLLFACRSSVGFTKIISTLTRTFLADYELRLQPSFSTFLRNLNSDDISYQPDLEELILDDLTQAMRGDLPKWNSVTDILENPNLRNKQSIALTEAQSNEKSSKLKSLPARIIDRMVNSLSNETDQEAILQGFEILLRPESTTAAGFVLYYGSSLLPKLLLLADSPQESTADKAVQLTSRIKKLMADRGAGEVSRSTSELIRSQLDSAGQPLSILSLIDLALEVLPKTTIEDERSTASIIFPSPEQWRVALKPFLNTPPSLVSAIVSPLQSLVFAVSHEEIQPHRNLVRDADDFSQALRLALYTTRLIRSSHILDLITEQQCEGLYQYYPQVLEFVNEKLNFDKSNDLWLSSTPEIIQEMVELVSEGRSLISTWIRQQESPGRQDLDHTSLSSCWIKLLDSMKGVSAHSYSVGTSFTSIMSECVDCAGPSKYASVWEERMKSLRTSSDLVVSASIIAITRDTLATSPQGKKLCNELIADATDLKRSENHTMSLRPLVLLNLLIQGDEDLIGNIPSQRVVFLIKNLLYLLQTPDLLKGFVSEVLKLLCYTISSIREMYGEHWEDILNFLATFWTGETDLDDDLPTLHSSLRLYARMKSLSQDDPNEDLAEAWTASSPDLISSLLRVLMLFGESKPGTNQPRDITTELLRRQLKGVDLPSSDDFLDMYPLMASQERSVQGTAYELLHHAIPTKQEQLSLDLALEKKSIQLPEELMSLLLHAPTMATFSNTQVSQETLWIDVRRYLLSWRLVYDHFTNASYKLKEAYSEDIKGSGDLSTLLDFICDLLKITSGRAVDASKFDIMDFQIDVQSSLEKEAQWIAIQLFYLSLLHVPGLAKDWFIQQKNRIKSPLETWTQKHISPLIVSASLATVSDWAKSQDDADDRPVSVKTSPKAAELVASITIDEESPPVSLAISLPGVYPLEPATVSTRNRVGVSEKNWQSWLRTFQVIIFTKGSIIEGLVAFRRNVHGALKGQSECAICYSIIGTDMQTPSKKCGTCKNTFHSSCLFRWFKSSNSSSCPLCRNNFNYA